MLDLSTSNFEILKIQVQNYSCLGCSKCTQLTNYDLRTKEGILNFLITKRTCFVNKLETRIENLSKQKEKVKVEIESYQELLVSLKSKN